MPVYKLPINDLLCRFVVDDSFSMRLVALDLPNIDDLSVFKEPRIAEGELCGENSGRVGLGDENVLDPRFQIEYLFPDVIILVSEILQIQLHFDLRIILLLCATVSLLHVHRGYQHIYGLVHLADITELAQPQILKRVIDIGETLPLQVNIVLLLYVLLDNVADILMEVSEDFEDVGILVLHFLRQLPNTVPLGIRPQGPQHLLHELVDIDTVMVLVGPSDGEAERADQPSSLTCLIDADKQLGLVVVLALMGLGESIELGLESVDILGQVLGCHLLYLFVQLYSLSTYITLIPIAIQCGSC